MRKLQLSVWKDIFGGKSYYHKRQPLGKCFDKKTIRGYYNDLIAKTEWYGIVDDEGVPLNVLTTGEKIYFPTTITQMALGYYDKWIIHKLDDYLETFMKLAMWLSKNQDTEGGWDTWSRFPYDTLSKYSAMVQGQAISVFARAYQVSGDRKFIDDSHKAFELLKRPIEEGGCAYIKNGKIFLEEIPLSEPNSVLNGWVFAIFGVYDYFLLSGEKMAENLYIQTLRTLKESIQRYDTGYWSYYDLSGRISSPFYHNLHISLLDALYIITAWEIFNEISKKWRMYETKYLNKFIAITKKIYQKIKAFGKEVVIAR